MNVEAAVRYAHENREQSLADLFELLRIPSISTLSEHRSDMLHAAEWLRDQLRHIGLTAELISGEGHPLVYAEWMGARGAPTVLVYGHYDVQPVDPVSLWESGPFEPTVRDGNLYCRGAADDKGQVMVAIAAAEAFLRATGGLPINLKFLLEGEEECGGEAVEAYIRSHGDKLKADVALISDTAMFAPGVPSLDTGLRGTVYTEMHARGAATDLHSGHYGGVAPNPLNALATIIAGLKGIDGRIRIPGFYDDVEMPTEDVLRSWRELPFDAEAMRQHEIGSSALVGEDGYSPLERMWARPTLDVHGIAGGFTAEGAKTVIPAEATAKISMRIVPHQTVCTVFNAYHDYAQALCPSGIELDVRLIHGGEPVVVSSDSPYVRASQDALQETFGKPAVLARSGGSIPVVGIIKESLGINSVLMGWGLPDDNLHAPNEKLSLDNFYMGIDATLRFWENVRSTGVRAS